MRIIQDQTFEGGRLELDGIRFERCRFVGTQLVYRGDDATDLIECAFQDCAWSLEGPSARTLDLLSSLYHHTGQEGRDLAEAIVAGIREGTIGPRDRLPVPAVAVPA